MNLKQLVSTLLRTKIFLLIIIAGAIHTRLLAANVVSATEVGNKYFDDDKNPGNKEKSFKNQNAVRIYQDVIKRKIHVFAKQENQKEIEFLVFDVNGNMILNYKMKAGEKKAISDLKKGSYMYYVFADDEYLMTGRLVFR